MIIVWRPRAQADFLSQIDYVRGHNQGAAERLHDDVLGAVKLLGSFPEMGRPGPRPGVRELIVTGTPYVIVYQVGAGRVRILRLFHAAQKRD